MNRLNTHRELQRFQTPASAPRAETNNLPLVKKGDGRKVLREHSVRNRRAARDVFSDSATPGARDTVARGLKASLPAQDAKRALLPLPASGAGRQARQAEVAVPVDRSPQARKAVNAQLIREEAKWATFTTGANAAMRYQGEELMHYLGATHDPRLTEFMARGVFPKGADPARPPNPANDPLRSLPRNDGVDSQLTKLQTKIGRCHYQYLMWASRRDKRHPNQAHPKVKKLEKRLNALLDEKGLQCDGNTLGAKVVAQMPTRLVEMTKAVLTNEKDSVKYACAKELKTKIEQYQRELKDMGALLRSPAFLAEFPAELQEVLKTYGQAILDMEYVLSHGRGIEPGPFVSLVQLADTVMEQTQAPLAPTAQAGSLPPKKPVPPTPDRRPPLSASARATTAQASFAEVLGPLVPAAKPLAVQA